MLKIYPEGHSSRIAQDRSLEIQISRLFCLFYRNLLCRIPILLVSWAGVLSINNNDALPPPLSLSLPLSGSLPQLVPPFCFSFLCNPSFAWVLGSKCDHLAYAKVSASVDGESRMIYIWRATGLEWDLVFWFPLWCPFYHTVTIATWNMGMRFGFCSCERYSVVAILMLNQATISQTWERSGLFPHKDPLRSNHRVFTYTVTHSIDIFECLP